MDAHRNQRSGLFRPRHVRRIPRSIPDEQFNELFARLTSHRDRALVAFWVSTGARAAELLGATAGDADAGQAGGSRAPGMYFYQLLRATGVFPQQAPATMRMFATQGQLSAGQLIDRYSIACRPVRDLLVAYLSEQQLTVGHASLRAMAHVLGKLFWRDLERRHPGIDSLRLAPEVAAGWKQRIHRGFWA